MKESSVSVQTDLSGTYIAALEEELSKRNEEIYELRKRLADVLWTEESFKNDDKKMSYYSGLPSFKLFKLILDELEPALSKIRIKEIDNFQKLLLTLMKLRFNISFKDLAYRFQISGTSASSCFRTVIVLIVYTFQCFLFWPDRDVLRTAMPECFKEAFDSSIVVITDCFEITTQRSLNAKARTKTFSNYEHNYSAKYLVGITPHGFVSFISDSWEGQASNKFISEHSGLLDNLLPGDVVMSDRGFTIKESFSMHYSELLTPEFSHNKMKLAPEDVEKTRKIASVRTHVEKVIGVMKNRFRILRGPAPTEFFKFKHNDNSILDYVVRSACILTNLCDSIVPMEEP